VLLSKLPRPVAQTASRLTGAGDPPNHNLGNIGSEQMAFSMYAVHQQAAALLRLNFRRDRHARPLGLGGGGFVLIHLQKQLNENRSEQKKSRRKTNLNIKPRAHCRANTAHVLAWKISPFVPIKSSTAITLKNVVVPGLPPPWRSPRFNQSETGSDSMTTTLE
jgi:hypothetical protein